MASTYKATTILTELVDLLAKELATPLPVINTYTDALGNPYAVLSATATLTTGNPVVLIRIMALPVTNLNTDILGNTAIKYSGHAIQIVTEKNSSFATGGSGATPPETALADILTPTSLLPILIECGRTGCPVDWYQTNNGTAVTIDGTTAALTGATLIASWKNLYWAYQTAT
jgi:hypothetical protein